MPDGEGYKINVEIKKIRIFYKVMLKMRTTT